MISIVFSENGATAWLRGEKTQESLTDPCTFSLYRSHNAILKYVFREQGIMYQAGFLPKKIFEKKSLKDETEQKTQRHDLDPTKHDGIALPERLFKKTGRG